ncbi:hypothetical protein C8J56DRAFT_501083 [Mycena floridula]|nr:hypothetical protein C8J56DRAFT_501083 [Mycena floridula]
MLFLSYPRPYAPPGEALPMTRETLAYVFLTQTVPLFAILCPPTASILIQTFRPSITSATSFLIDLGLTIAALGTIMMSVRTGAFSDQVMHSFFLMIVWTRPAFELWPVETKKVLAEALIQALVVILVILAVLFSVAGLVVSWIHRCWGFVDTRDDWNRALEVMMFTMRLCCLWQAPSTERNRTSVSSLSHNQNETLFPIRSAPMASQADPIARRDKKNVAFMV